MAGRKGGKNGKTDLQLSSLRREWLKQAVKKSGGEVQKKNINKYRAVNVLAKVGITPNFAQGKHHQKYRLFIAMQKRFGKVRALLAFLSRKLALNGVYSTFRAVSYKKMGLTYNSYRSSRDIIIKETVITRKWRRVIYVLFGVS
jgi:hypothetical protein